MSNSNLQSGLVGHWELVVKTYSSSPLIGEVHFWDRPVSVREVLEAAQAGIAVCDCKVCQRKRDLQQAVEGLE